MLPLRLVYVLPDHPQVCWAEIMTLAQFYHCDANRNRIRVCISAFSKCCTTFPGE